MRPSLSLLLMLMLFLLTAVLVHAKDWEGKILTIDGIVHVQNPETPAGGERILEPERLWMIGGDSDADEEMFGAITKILVDDDGNTYLLDSQIMQVKVFSPEGKFLRSLKKHQKRGVPKYLIADYIGVGLACEGKGDYEKARDWFQKAINLIEKQWQTLGLSAREGLLAGRVGAGFSRIEPYEGMVRVLLKQKKETLHGTKE